VRKEEQRRLDYFCYSFLLSINFNVTILRFISEHIVTDLINALPDNNSVNIVQHATIEETVFSVDPTDTPIDWLEAIT
jgi:hypothetical protein